MPLTEKQQHFLNKYISSFPFKMFSAPKQKRANKFALQRDLLLNEINALPETNRMKFLLELESIDTQAEGLKFNRARDRIDFLLSEISLINLNTQQDENTPANSDKIQELKLLLNSIESDDQRAISLESIPQIKGVGSDFSAIHKEVKALLNKNDAKISDTKKAAILLGQLKEKRNYIEKSLNEVIKLKKRLSRDANYVINHENSQIDTNNLPDDLKRAVDLSELPDHEWTEELRREGMSLYLNLTLKISNLDNIEGKDFKLREYNKDKEDREIVYAVRRKYKKVEGSHEEGPNEDPLINKDIPNFKLVVKPLSREVAGSGLTPGSQGGREAMGSLMSNKLQELMGIDFRLPETHLSKIDGGLIGMKKDTEEWVSTQYFKDEGKDLVQIAKANGKDVSQLNAVEYGSILDQEVESVEIQKMALFDLISLNTDRHCENMLVTKDRSVVPIDQGIILPTLKVLKARQSNVRMVNVVPETETSKMKFDKTILEAIELLDPDKLQAGLTEGLNNLPTETSKDGIAEGIQLTKRSTEFLKFAAKHLTIKQIYSCYDWFTDLIFKSPDDKKDAIFKKIVKSTIGLKSNKEYICNKLELKDSLNLDISKNPVVMKKLEGMGWLKFGIAMGNVSGLRPMLIDSIREILENKISAPSLHKASIKPPSDQIDLKIWNLFQGLGGREACKRHGIRLSADDRLTTDKVISACAELQRIMVLNHALP